MKRLSGTDALFLSTETPSWHQHVGGVVVLDVDSDNYGGYPALREILNKRLDAVPKYRWRLKEIPLNLDRPVWVEDESFDIDRHFRRIAVPSPGGPRELGDLIGTLMSHQLDRRAPLWELWYVEGVANGHKAALIMKYHHCLMDGSAGADLAAHLFDLTPDWHDSEPTLPEAPQEQQHPGSPRVPSDLELVARAAVGILPAPVRIARYGAELGRRGTHVIRHALRRDGTGLSAPITSFNRPVGPRRQLAFASVSMDDMRAVRQHYGVKVNDVVLALVSGAVRDYLADRGETIDKSLVAAVPVSTRVSTDATDDGNKVANMPVSLATDVSDPVERLMAIAASSAAAKDMTKAVRARTIQSVGEIAPPLLVGIASRTIWGANLAATFPVPFNMIVSNVPGPPIDLFVRGARVTGIFAASVLAVNIGLNVTVMSYGNRLDLGIMADPDQVPDVWSIADRVQGHLAALMKAGDLGDLTEVATAFGDLEV